MFKREERREKLEESDLQMKRKAPKDEKPLVLSPTAPFSSNMTNDEILLLVFQYFMGSGALMLLATVAAKVKNKLFNYMCVTILIGIIMTDFVDFHFYCREDVLLEVKFKPYLPTSFGLSIIAGAGMGFCLTCLVLEKFGRGNVIIQPQPAPAG